MANSGLVSLLLSRIGDDQDRVMDNGSSVQNQLTSARRLLSQGELAKAHQACDAILAQHGESAEAWALSGEIRLRMGRAEEALKCLRAACRHAPNRVEHLVRVGSVLAMQGRINEAREVADRALRATPIAAPLLSNLGFLFSACDRYQQAVSCFQQAADNDPSNSTYLYNLATAQRAVGDLLPAESSCDRAIKLHPHDAQAQYLRSDLRKQTLQSNHVTELQAILTRSSNLSPRDRSLLCFALAKELEDIGQYQQSFQYLSAGAATHRSMLRYDVTSDVKAIEAIIHTHSAEHLALCSQGYEDAAPIFVVGLPRSGTTLVERILQSHRDIVSVGERNDFALEMVRLIRTSYGAEPVPREEIVRRALSINMRELGRQYVERVTPADVHVACTLDKMPINYLYCGLIHAALPHAKIVSVRRNPMDSCYSAFKAFLTGPYSFTFDQQELGRYFLAYRRLMAHWRATLPADAYIEIDYESIVSDFETECRRMLEFLGLSWQERMTNFFQSAVPSATASAAQVRQPLYASSIGKWKHYRKQLAPLEAVLRAEITNLDDLSNV